MLSLKIRQVLAATLAMDADTLTGSEQLRDLDGWDSMASLTFITGVDRAFGIALSGSQVVQCQTVAELAALLDDGPIARAA